MLIGGALMGIGFSFQSIKSAFRSLRSVEILGKNVEELPLKVLGIAIVLATLVLFTASYGTSPADPLRALF